MNQQEQLPMPQEDRPEPEGRQGRALLRAAQVAWQRRSLLLLGIGVGLLFGVLYYVVTSPTYRSTAQVLVVKKRPDEITGKDTRNLAIEDYVATQQILVSSPLIIERAIEKHSLGSLPTFRNWEQKYAERGETLPELIRKWMSVTRGRGATGYNNAVLDLSFRGNTPEDCQLVIDAVLSSYREFLEETYRNMSDDTLDLIIKARDELTNDLHNKEAVYQEFRGSSPVLTAKGGEGRDIRHESLGTIQIRRASLALARSEIQAQLAAIEDAQKSRRPPAVVLAMIMDFSAKADGDDPRKERMPSAQVANQMLPLLVEEQRLLDVYGPNHLEVLSIRRRIEAAREVLIRPAAGLNTAPAQTNDSNAAAKEAINGHVVQLKQKLEYLQTSERLLAEEYEKEHAKARLLTSYEVKDEHLRKDIARTQSLYDALIKRLQDVSFVKQAGGYDARIIAPPLPGRKIAPSAILVFPIAILLGAIGGIGLIYLVEITDSSFRSPEEVGKRLSLPVVGYIPRLKLDRKSAAPSPGSCLDASLVASHLPRSESAETFRGVRTALYFGTRGKRQQVIQVTSPLQGDGKSTLSANLAITIAQSSKRTLLIDADLRRPTLHKLFGLSAEQGLSSVISEEVKSAEAIQKSCIANLSVLTCGTLPPNPAELLTSDRFHELLDSFRAEYDFVIVDSPPLLVVTDASVIAPTVDGVILVVRMRAHARHPAERSRQVLESLGATVVGVVVNDIQQRRQSGYGYSGYGGYGEDGNEAENGLPPEAARVDPPIAASSNGDQTKAPV
jgi:capsular exopolysaccharide synthesis family protein